MKALRNRVSDHKVHINPKNNACQVARCSYHFKLTSLFSYCTLSFFFLQFSHCASIYVLVFISIRETKTLSQRQY